jgi:translation initiation factor 4E
LRNAVGGGGSFEPVGAGSARARVRVRGCSPHNSTKGSVNGDAIAAAGPGEPLTTEQVEKLAQKTSILEKQTMKKTKGFKSIPTLDVIPALYARTRTLSVEGIVVLPEAEPIEDPQTPGLMTKPPEHPLQHP